MLAVGWNDIIHLIFIYIDRIWPIIVHSMDLLKFTRQAFRRCDSIFHEIFCVDAQLTSGILSI